MGMFGQSIAKRGNLRTLKRFHTDKIILLSKSSQEDISLKKNNIPSGERRISLISAYHYDDVLNDHSVDNSVKAVTDMIE